MKRILLLSLILLSACNTAAGPVYNSTNVTQTSFVVYYDHSGPDTSQPISLRYNGKTCVLHDKGFLVITSQQADLLATSPNSKEISRLSVATSRTAYIRIDSNNSTDAKDSKNTGPYKFLVITDEKQAHQELKGFRQDCL